MGMRIVPLTQLAWRAIGTYSPEQIADRLRIPHGSKEGLNPGPTEVRKEILHVYPQHHAPSHVRSHKCSDRPALPKPVRRWMRRNPIEDPFENLPLQLLQARLRRFDQPHLA